MARPPDPDLEDRILKAARKLWKKGAERALTMRAIAQAAGTNTPAVYRRFACREDIQRALLQRTKDEVFRQLQNAPSVEEACERYLDFAESHPHEYELYYVHEYKLLFSARAKQMTASKLTFKQKRPAVQLMEGKLAAQLGGAPDDYLSVTLTIWALLHGTAMLLLTKMVPPEHRAEMREACRASLQTLLRESRAPQTGPPSKRG